MLKSALLQYCPRPYRFRVAEGGENHDTQKFPSCYPLIPQNNHDTIQYPNQRSAFFDRPLERSTDDLNTTCGKRATLRKRQDPEPAVFKYFRVRWRRPA
ncbi:uncharacterized protein YALI1_D05739g [Yarrowia lipolytica]|uniref:Uncharacterized protein n=1 Tax=Yarrowia lipolytica TaxID=4952 RepID=A0A1D8ND73_YARLL|nr:hypothetical protein YALI1_D05739g [Yarrowia lipolytica]